MQGFHYLLKHIWKKRDVITIVILLVSDPATLLVREIVNIVVLSHARLDAKAVVKVAVNIAVVENPVHLHPTITPNNLLQVAPIVQGVARTVVLLAVGQLVMINVRVVAKQHVKAHARVGVQAVVKRVAKILAKQDVKIPVILVAKKPVNGVVKLHVKVLVKVVVIMLVIQLAKELAREDVHILAYTIAQGVAGQLIDNQIYYIHE